MPIPSSDDSQPDTVNSQHGSRRIGREIANLQQEIRDDFDQKLKELAGLMHKFKSLLGHDSTSIADLSRAANESNLRDSPSTVAVIPSDETISDASVEIPLLTDRVCEGIDSKPGASQPKTVGGSLTSGKNTTDPLEKRDIVVSKPTPVSGFLTEPARFETGLYLLNSQLYRFKLELDQELEFREEPLHIHFQHQSELAKVLQQITEKMQQEKNIDR